MSAQEKQAKTCLLNLQTQEFQEHYDPYRLQSILKESHNSEEIKNNNQPKIKKNSMKTLSKNDIERSDNKKVLPNNRQSLKKLLRKLQEMPSPQKRPKKTTKVKTLGAITAAQPLIEIKQCFRVKSAKREEKTEEKKVKNIYNEDEQIRKLIKKKVSMKRENENNQKIQKINNFLRQNHKIKPLSKRNSFYRKGSQSKKLINLLF